MANKVASTFCSGMKAGPRPAYAEEHVFAHYVYIGGYNSGENSRIIGSGELFHLPIGVRSRCFLRNEKRPATAPYYRSIVRCGREEDEFHGSSGILAWEFHSEDQSNQIADPDSGLQLARRPANSRRYFSAFAGLIRRFSFSSVNSAEYCRARNHCSASSPISRR